MALRDSLRREGFAPFYPGVWIVPGDLREAVMRKADLRGVEQLSAHLVEDASFMVRGRHPIQSWDLEGINAAYATVIDESNALWDEFTEGKLSPTTAQVRRASLLARYRRVVPLDPGLPLAHMPEGWLRRDARQCVADAVDALAPLAAMRIDQLLDCVADAWADRVRAAAQLKLDEVVANVPGPPT